MDENVKAAIGAIEAAIYDEGPAPSVHRSIMHRHREEWPTLWAALDLLLEATNRA